MLRHLVWNIPNYILQVLNFTYCHCISKLWQRRLFGINVTSSPLARRGLEGLPSRWVQREELYSALSWCGTALEFKQYRAVLAQHRVTRSMGSIRCCPQLLAGPQKFWTGSQSYLAIVWVILLNNPSSRNTPRCQFCTVCLQANEHFWRTAKNLITSESKRE